MQDQQGKIETSRGENSPFPYKSLPVGDVNESMVSDQLYVSVD